MPSGARGMLVLDPGYRDAVVDGVPLDRTGPQQKTRSSLSAGRHIVTFRLGARPAD